MPVLMTKSTENAESSSAPTLAQKYWLLKAEPDPRIVKGKDVKFSVDDFERVGTSPWEGVRNFEARNIMKEMKVGDKALFYHSNCKTPGIAAFAEVSKEAYPDYTAWDASHPYYDIKSDSQNPKWYMVDLTFKSRAKHFVPLALLKYIADLPNPGSPTSAGTSSSQEPRQVDGLPGELAYIGVEGVRVIKGMDLVTRGRLSVQRVKKDEWDVIGELAETGGWDEVDLKSKGKAKKAGQAKKKDKAEEEMGDEDGEEEMKLKSKRSATSSQTKKKASVVKAKRKREESDLEDVEGDSESEPSEDDDSSDFSPQKRGQSPRKKKKRTGVGRDKPRRSGRTKSKK